MTDTLLLISIGPVQDFIASARKLRDLWFGSNMLSEFSKTVARTLVENGAELIFPAPNSQADLDKDSQLIVANKILAIVNSPEDAERIQSKAHEAWRAHFNRLEKSTLSSLEQRFKNISVNVDLFNAEIRDYGEFFAAWTSINNSELYQEARSRVENLLASRKNFRAFKAPSWDGTGIPKNSLDGMRESVFRKNPPEITGLLKKHEKLDAIGCIKRFSFLSGDIEKKHFTDLAEMALVPWLKGIENNLEQINLVNNFQNSVPSRSIRNNRQVSEKIPLNIDAENFFYGLDEFKGEYKDKAESIWDWRKAMVEQCGEPPRYSVVMVGDGDRMGEMIKAISDKDMHKQFSRKLSDFAKGVAPIIEEAGGSLIYAGGDDVMAYLPLNTAIECADKIRKMFHAEMKNLCESIGLATEKASTFSAGLAVVHYKYPLDKALELARKAESVAKDAGRNSLALIQSKRSGSDVLVFGKWETDEELPGIAERLGTICNLYNLEKKVLPSKLGYDLRRAMIETGGNSEMQFSSIDGDICPKNVTAALVLGIFDQKNDGNSEKNKQLRELLAGRKDVDQLSNELVVGWLIAKAQKMANGKGQADE